MQLLGEIPALPALGNRIPVRLTTFGTGVHLATAGLPDATHQLVNVLGRPFLVHLSERDRYISQSLQADGYWEFAETAVLSSMIRAGGTVLDLGANIGYYTVQMARLIGNTGVVYAAEPEPTNFQLLVVNSLLAAVHESDLGRFELQRFAVGATCGPIQLQVAVENLGLHSLHWKSNSGGRSIDVPSFSLDRLRFGGETSAVITRPIDFIKADTQGAELDILRGGERTIAADRPNLLLEFEPYISGEERCGEILDWLNTHGYDRLRLFYANETQRLRMLEQLNQIVTPAQVERRLRNGELGAYCSLFAQP